MSEEKQEEAQPPRIDSRLFRRIISFLVPYKGWVFLALTLTIAAAFFGPLRPKLVQLAVDDYIVPGDLPGLQYIIILLMLVLVAESILAFVNAYLTQWIGQQAIYDLRTRIFRHIQRQPLGFFDRTPLGRLISRVTSDVEVLNDVFSAGIVTILGDLFRLAFIAMFMFWLNWQLALVALTVMPLMLYVTAVFRRKVRDAYRDTRKHVARLHAFLQEHISGMKIVQVFNREREEARRFREVNDDHRGAQIRTIFYFALFWPAVDIMSSLALGLVIWFGGLRAMGDMLTLGVLIAFIQYVRLFFEPIRNLSDQYNTLQSAMAASERIFDLLDSDESLPEPDSPVVMQRFRGHVEFKNVWFSYEPMPAEGEPNWVLRDVSFSVQPGESVALVGATGSGKTTVINLLLRFYEVNQGQILIDGVDIRSYRLKDLRRHIGLVLQDIFLFSGTVEKNITLGDHTITREQVRASARMVGADDFIRRLPEGYNQDVRERGATLSVGQRQLLSFVRALVYDPEILVLDEATSSVDVETEQLIQNAMERLMKGRTNLVVAHRLSTIQHADQILVMHKGQIRERGNHQRLLALGGLYRKLYELQYREQESVKTLER